MLVLFIFGFLRRKVASNNFLLLFGDVLLSYLKRMSNNVEINPHERYEYCTTRLKYRQGKDLKAVKVYTVANESKHLLIFGVPKINLQNELKKAFQRYGSLSLTNATDSILKDKKIELEQFTEVFHIKFDKLEHARRAKRFLDAKQFYGGILHISYAPEYESLEEIRGKLQQRKREIIFRIKLNNRT